MPVVAVTPVYAGLLAFLYIFLTFSVIRQRREKRISLGDGGDARLQRNMRAHGNFSEYVPLALVLMALAEIAGAATVMIHVIGALLIAGRLAHAWCFLFTERNLPARVAGMVMTIGAVAIGGGVSLSAGLAA